MAKKTAAKKSARQPSDASRQNGPGVVDARAAAHAAVKYAERILGKCLDQSHTPLLGVTDSAVIALATKRECPVLTDDAMLYHWLQQAGLPALNFNHLRFERF
jgi:rRNA-processing protein FCF1